MLTLGLGIGATAAIFSVVDAVLLTDLPYAEPHRIIRAWAHADDGDIVDFSFRVVEYRELALRTGTFDAVGGEFPISFTALIPEQEPRQIDGRMVTSDFFRVFGTGPDLGRMFDAEEIAAGDVLVAVVSHGFWTRQLGADPAAIDRPIDLGGRLFRVIGVLPEGYRHISGDDVEIFVPFTIGTSGWIARWLDLYLLLGDDVAPFRAREEIDAVMAGIGADDRRSADWHATVEPLHEMVVGDIEAVVIATFVITGLVLLIACVNVANLTLARSTVQVAEITVRKALGAGRAGIVRQSLVESLMVAVAGGVLGIAVGLAGMRTLIALAPASIPRLTDATFDWTVLVFCTAVTAATGLAFGLLPAIGASRLDLAGGLRQAWATGGAARLGGTLGALVVSEVAIALMLLVGAGLMVRTFQELLNEDAGFERGGALSFRVIAPSSRWPGAEGTLSFYDQLRDGLAGLPGVTAVGAGTNLPLSGEGAVSTVTSEERFAAGIEEGVTTLQRRATAGYFEALGTPLLAGRGFDATERTDSETVAVISASLAHRLFPGEEAVGRRIAFGVRPDDTDWMRVVGVVADVRFRGPARIDDPQIYQAHPQSATREMAVIVRTTGDPRALLEASREVLRDLDAQVAMYAVATLDDVVDSALAGRRFTMAMFSLFAAVALTLTVAGIYGVLAFSVGRRRREIGVRMALGAHGGDIARLVVWEGMVLVAAGLVLGLAGAAAAARFLEGLVYGVTTLDPSTYVAVTVVLAAVGAVACYLPARQGARVDPMAVLRQD